MADINFLPSRLDLAFSRLAFPEAAKALFAFQAGNPAYCSLWDDFIGDALDAKYAASVGTGTQTVGVTEGLNGTATLTTDTNTNDSAGLLYQRHWDGTRGFYFIARAKLDTITLSKFEIGVADAVTGDTGMVATKATPTHTGTSYAVFCRDTTDDTNVTFISAAGGATGANSDWSGTFSADTYYTFEIRGQNGAVSGYINGQFVGGGAITAATDVTPHLFVQTRTGAARTLTVDYQGIIGPRV